MLQRDDDGGRVRFRDAESLREGRQGAGRGSAARTERRQQRGEEDMHPLIGCALDHPE